MTYQPLYDVAELCSRRNVRQVVLCPGSRSAPLTLAFTRHKELSVRVFSDERSAAFIALGIAQATQAPTALVCTSGTAALNFAPAIAEAHYQQVPLVVFTADRPPEWIDQLDGQTIRQQNLYEPHVKRSFTLPVDYQNPDAVWAIQRIVNEAVNLANTPPFGPVHVNCPFREPLYPDPKAKITYSKDLRAIECEHPSRTLSEQQLRRLSSAVKRARRILVVIGQSRKESLPVLSLGRIIRSGIPVVGEIHANVHDVRGAITRTDLFLNHLPDSSKKSLQPDLLITSGLSLLTRSLKTFLRQYPAAEHWHIDEGYTPADPLQSLTRHINTSPDYFYKWLADEVDASKRPASIEKFAREWNRFNRSAADALSRFLKTSSFGELQFVRDVLHKLPANANLHLANSMAIRYANLIGIPPSLKGLQVFANRGTSGIDGCTSTAVGHVVAGKRPTVLITGDVGFFYDRNAFWHNYPLGNFTTALINNHGGVIFRLIDGPGNQPEADTYFVTHQRLGATSLCREFGFQHIVIHPGAWRGPLIRKNRSTVIEAEFDGRQTKAEFDSLKKYLKKYYETY